MCRRMLGGISLIPTCVGVCDFGRGALGGREHASVSFCFSFFSYFSYILAQHRLSSSAFSSPCHLTFPHLFSFTTQRHRLLSPPFLGLGCMPLLCTLWFSKRSCNAIRQSCTPAPTPPALVRSCRSQTGPSPCLPSSPPASLLPPQRPSPLPSLSLARSPPSPKSTISPSVRSRPRRRTSRCRTQTLARLSRGTRVGTPRLSRTLEGRGAGGPTG